MKLKKLAALMLAAVMGISAAGCSVTSESSDSTSNSQTSESSEASDTNESSETSETSETSEAPVSSDTTKAPESSEPDKEETDISLSAAEVAKNMGIGISLGNTMEAYSATDCEKITYEWIPTVGSNTPKNYETCWGAVETTQEVIDGMKAAGFNTVRIPVFWGNMMENDGNWDINPDYIARVKEIVDYCVNDDLYVVVNIHHFDEFIIRRHSLSECEEIFNHLWVQIAEYFKDYPYTVVFEGFNEYLGGNQFNEKGELVELDKSDGYLLTNTLNQTFVDAVRGTGGKNADRVLIASGYWTNIDLTSSEAFVMPADTVEDRLMVSVHYVDNAMYWTNKIGGKEWKAYIDDQCSKLEKAFTENNIPVFMGETTAYYPHSNFVSKPEIEKSYECLEYVLNKLTDCGFVPVLWDTNDNFYSRTNYKIKDENNAKVVTEIAEKIKNN